MLLSRLIHRDHVYLYTGGTDSGGDFDSSIHEELKRQRRCVERALTGYFTYSQ